MATSQRVSTWRGKQRRRIGAASYGVKRHHRSGVSGGSIRGVSTRRIGEKTRSAIASKRSRNSGINAARRGASAALATREMA